MLARTNRAFAQLGPAAADRTVVSGYGGGDQPFTHPNDDHRLGGDYKVDYTKINKMPPLRSGSGRRFA